MRVIDYDNAMEARWRAYYKNSYFVNSEENALHEVRNRIAQENPSFDQTTQSIFPLLTIRRIGIPEMLEDMNLVAATQGLRYGKQECRVPFIKFKLRYQVDLYASSRQNFDEMAVEIQENLTRFQFMCIVTNDPVWGAMDITIDKEGVEDNSDVDSREETVNLYRASFTYTIDAIISRKFRHLSVKKFVIELDDTTQDDGDNDGSTIVDGDTNITLVDGQTPIKNNIPVISTLPQMENSSLVYDPETNSYKEVPSEYTENQITYSAYGRSEKNY
jgi:hypothetical protein